MTIPKQMIERAACVIAGNVSKAQWDANPDLHGEHLEYAEKALEGAGVGELIEALMIARHSIAEDIELVGYDADELEDHPAIGAIDSALAKVGVAS